MEMAPFCLKHENSTLFEFTLKLVSLAICYAAEIQPVKVYIQEALDHLRSLHL